MNLINCMAIGLYMAIVDYDDFLKTIKTIESELVEL